MQKQYVSIVDYEKKQTIVPEEITVDMGVILSHGAFRCWVVLKHYARRYTDDGIAVVGYPSMETIGKAMGISPWQAHKYIDQLNEIGLVLIKKKTKEKGFGVINNYKLIDPKRWWKIGGKAVMERKKNLKSKSYKKQSQTLRKYKDSTD